MAFKYTNRVLLIWDMLCISLGSMQNFLSVIPKLMRALQVLLSGGEKNPSPPPSEEELGNWYSKSLLFYAGIFSNRRRVSRAQI